MQDVCIQQALAASLVWCGVDASSLEPLGPPAAGLFRLSTGGSQAIPRWHRLRAAVAETGRWPVVIGGDDETAGLIDELGRQVAREPRQPEGQPILPGLEAWTRSIPPAPPPAEIVRHGLALIPSEWFRERVAGNPSHSGEPHGPWPAGASTN
jgi:hypothetical protein